MVEIVRSLIRPILTTLFGTSWLVTTIALTFTEAEPTLEYWVLTVLAWGLIVWWYDDRTYFHRHSSPLAVIFGKKP